MKAKKDTFNENNLSPKTKLIHQSQEKWRDNNWKDTLRIHGNKIETLIEKISYFDKWQNSLQNNEACKLFIPEIFIDAWTSIHMACFGLYKYANMLLRSELENSLKLVYFSTHPIEFSWWKDQNDSYRNSLQSGDVWGQRYTYFEQLKAIKKLKEVCGSERSLFSGNHSIDKVHRRLSQFIHSGAGHFQTRPERTIPRYDRGEFEKWHGNFTIVQENINVLLLTQFPKEFNDLPKGVRQEMLEKVIGNYYATKLDSILNNK